MKLSAFSGYATGIDEWAYREMPTLALFNTLAKYVDATRVDEPGTLRVAENP